uniref:assimilatory sulfite reductase (NADPH) flavoprotein subunit n=1 Tax=Ningiella ruwaisensis TaxID=2364274 RepID=UPI00109F9A0D|nr:assimilatory sulfite reductase (NADPH) flavoprotein subunit [Ningiella ruwaisensis]
MASSEDRTAISLLGEAQLSQLSAAVAGFNRDQLVWASGYLAGLSQVASSQALADLSPVGAKEAPTLTILYGSQTGNAKHSAIAYGESAKAKGFSTNVVSMADYKPRKLKDESHLVIFVSTHGEGDAPDDAVELHEFLASKKAPKLPNLNYAVVGLGDTSYEFFCQTGKDFDKRLSALGAKAVIDRLDCDVEFEAELAAWSEKLNDILSSALTADVSMPAPSAVAEAVSTSVYTKQHPFLATLTESIKITGRDSVKDIRHIEISLEDSGIRYQPGDALGVYFVNSENAVARVLHATSNDGEAQVTINDESLSLQQALSEKLELTLSYPGFVKAYQEASKNEALKALLEDKAALRAFLEERQIIDIVEQFPENIAPQDLVNALRPLTPRLYSIASSQLEVEDEVHLTVAHVDYDAFGFRHQGGASGFLCEHLAQGGQIKVYAESNDNFRLPSDDDTAIIMVGPGTGIAPFRAFMQERDVKEAKGKNWLFFGNPSFTQDFLYQTEWQSYLKSGLLSKISLAFSRDQANKIYVQDRMLENGKELFDWLESGAHFYVCGDAMRMAKDVEAALLQIIEKYGNKTEAEAKQYLLGLRKAKRYQKDVY